MKRSIVFYALFIFFFNFVWESWHGAYLYVCPFHEDVKKYVGMITYASFVDTLILLAIFFGGALIWKNTLWYQTMNAKKYSYFIFASIFISAFIEYKAVFLFKQWSYTPLMPTIFGIGLSPLIQLPATGLCALWMARFMKK